MVRRRKRLLGTGVASGGHARSNGGHRCGVQRVAVGGPQEVGQRQHPPALAAERQQLVVPALAAAQPQKAVGQDAAFEEGVELVLQRAWKRALGAEAARAV
jgi:hypothetical protein